MATKDINSASELVTLHGEHTYLQAVRLEDQAEFLAMALESRSFHMPWTTAPSTEDEFRQYVERATSERFVGLCLFRNVDPRLIGVFNFSEIVRGAFQNAYLGFYAHASWAGKGLMSEGLILALRYAFEVLKLHRVEANIQPDNVASIRLVKRCGFAREGFSPKYLKIGGRWRDHERWAIRADDDSEEE